MTSRLSWCPITWQGNMGKRSNYTNDKNECLVAWIYVRHNCANLCSLFFGKSDLLIIFSWHTAKNMKNKGKLCMFSYVFSKVDCFQSKAMHPWFIFIQTKSPFNPSNRTLSKNFQSPYNNALWRHILTGYDFYSSVNWNNLVTTFMQKFQNLLYPLMLDIIVFCLVDYNMQYGLSA